MDLNMKPVMDRLNRGVCPIVCDRSGGRYRVNGVGAISVSLYDMARRVDLSFPIVEFCRRLSDARIMLEND